MEVASGLWARSLALADVTPSSPALAGLSADILSDIGSGLCRHGEVLYSIDVEDGRVVLYPVADFDVRGSFDQKSWAYRVALAGPTSTTTKTLSSDQVLHFKLSCDPSQPWRGRSPLSRCPETAAFAAHLETMLKREAAGPQGFFLSVPEASDPNSDQLADLRTGIANAQGHPILHETTVTGYGDEGSAPHSELRQTRFGAAWPQAVSEMRDPIFQSVMLALGVPTSLSSSTDSTAAREGLRRFLTTTIKPVAKIIKTELKTKLDPEASLSFSELAASDIIGKARARRQSHKSGHGP